MRFGRSFHEYQIAEWAEQYVNYNLWKRRIKNALRNETTTGNAHRENCDDVLEFLMGEVERVNEVYSRKCTLIQHYLKDFDGRNKGRQMLRKVIWFGKLNADAFTKLAARLITADIEGADALSRKVQHCEFFKQRSCIIVLEQLGNNGAGSEYDKLDLREFPGADLLDSKTVHELEVKERSTFIHLTVAEGHLDRVRSFLISYKQTAARPLLSELVLIALRSGKLDIAQLLIDYGADITDYQDSWGESAIYIAVRTNQIDFVDRQLQSRKDIKVDLAENARGWTPLISACVEGSLRAVDLLLDYGATPNVVDLCGWIPMEHAGFQGHLKVMDGLTRGSEPHLNGIKDVPNNKSPVLPAAQRKSRIKALKNIPITQESLIFVTLGGSNLRKRVKTVDLSPALAFPTPQVPDELGFALKVTALGASGSSGMIYLPVPGDKINEPWLFTTAHPDDAKLLFQLYKVKSYAEGHVEFIGSGIALLQSLKEGLNDWRESLIRDFTVPIIGNTNGEFLGSVRFGFLTVTPYTGRKGPIKPVGRGFWSEEGPIQIVGHRGSGANTSATTNLQIGENTIQSFKTAPSLGASCVEFDVQLTRDMQTAIFHDFLVMETGGEIPINILTREQFQLLGDIQYPRADRSGLAEARYFERNGDQTGATPRPRARSVNEFDEYRRDDTITRMKHTIASKYGIHGNVRGLAIQEPFTTLEEILTRLPESIAFDLEIKYPMLWEAEDRCFEPYATEVNLFLDTILDVVYPLAGTRNITFSSFSPEICILLAFKQRDYPTVFITKSGAQPAGDIRAANLQQAIQFAKSWGLDGIVAFGNPLAACPRLVKYARDPGMICATYGNVNDDPDQARILAEAGLDAIVVNKVRLISEALSKK